MLVPIFKKPIKENTNFSGREECPVLCKEVGLSLWLTQVLWKQSLKE